MVPALRQKHVRLIALTLLLTSVMLLSLTSKTRHNRFVNNLVDSGLIEENEILEFIKKPGSLLQDDPELISAIR